MTKIDLSVFVGRPGMIWEYDPKTTAYPPFVVQCTSCLVEDDPSDCPNCAGTRRQPIPDTEMMVSLRHYVRRSRG